MRWWISASESVDLRKAQARMVVGAGPSLAQGGHGEGKKEAEKENKNNSKREQLKVESRRDVKIRRTQNTTTLRLTPSAKDGIDVMSTSTLAVWQVQHVRVRLTVGLGESGGGCGNITKRSTLIRLTRGGRLEGLEELDGGRGDTGVVEENWW